MRALLYGLFIAASACSWAQPVQQAYSGYVSDSVTMAPLAGVHVAIKNRLQGTVTSDKGFFTLTAQRTDTLVFSLTGYQVLELPLFFEENVILVRLREKVTYLEEVKITGSRLLETVRPSRPLPKPLDELSAFANPIEYFSRWQRERRKLLKLVDENNKTYVYNQVINDEGLRQELLREFRLDEITYYRLLTRFNEYHREVQYFTSVEKIIEALKQFLKEQTN
ncbi:MAG: carboxypeptidase-like regulatory domain-containing protein [Cyclobacteriaceae bacterium]|nr:carboxypeptidase-like regulatory domain-containing protein [Cyclobacteriaceae bacterium]